MEDTVLRLLCLGNANQLGMSQRARNLVDSITAINRSFLKTKLPLRVSMVNVYSTMDSLALQVSTCSTSYPKSSWPLPGHIDASNGLK